MKILSEKTEHIHKISDWNWKSKEAATQQKKSVKFFVSMSFFFFFWLLNAYKQPYHVSINT